MTAVLVHGNPETAAIWDPLVAELAARGHDDVVRLSPPGFGAPLPTTFDATVDGYRDWLIAELETMPAPVDLVGHDWGGGHVVNVAMTRPDLLRSWVTDAIGIFDPEYAWHDLAQGWQTPGTGEARIAERFGAPLAVRIATLLERGITPAVAAAVAAGQDDTMGHAVLSLYRSAAQPAMADLGRALTAAAQRPGLCVVATADHVVGTDAMRRRTAARAGADVALLDGLGHWWMVADPARAADVIADFWTRRP